MAVSSAALKLLLFFALASFVSGGCEKRLGRKNEHEVSTFDQTVISLSQNCSTCSDGSSCCDNQECCGTGNSVYCCPTGSGCCNGTCCFGDAKEFCCPDEKNGGICCITEVTQCCQPNDSYPSRCCPRWMVCCNGGRYGCCDPETMEPIEDLQSTYAYGLYADAMGDFYSLKIDMSSGDYSYQTVTGFNDFGEMTRVFIYNEDLNLFYLLQANFTTPGYQHAINLFTVDPVKATTTSQIVQGAVDDGVSDVTGFVYIHATEQIIMGTQITDSNNNVLKYNFYSVNPQTAVATLISSYNNSGSISDVGWFDDISNDGKYIYRIGYRDVYNQLDNGVGVTDISQPTAVAKWVNQLSVPKGLNFYESLNVYGNSFISLAEDSFGDYSVVQWDLNGNSKVLYEMNDGYNTPYFGPTIEYVNLGQSIYGSLVVYDSDINSDFDRWSLVVTQLPSGNSQELVLWPWILAQINSVSALGFQ